MRISTGCGSSGALPSPWAGGSANHQSAFCLASEAEYQDSFDKAVNQNQNNSSMTAVPGEKGKQKFH